MDDSWHSGQSLLHHPNRNIVLFSNPPRTDYSHHQQIHPLAVQQHNHPPFGASTSRNAALVASAEAAPQNECVTAWEPLQLRQEWTIHNFTKALDLATFGTCMRSRNFRDESMPDICWQLCLYPGGKREENSGNVSLFLKMSTTENQREFTVRAEYRFYFLDDTGAARFSNVNTGDFKVKPAKGSHSWGLRNIPRQKVLNCIRSNNSLHIVCQIELVPDFNKLQTHVRREHRIDPIILTKEFLERNHKMFISGEGSDCIVECGNQEFPVHKFVLMAHSDVFRAMFNHKDTLESVESRIRITDFGPETVHQMLTYMYSGGLPEDFSDEQASNLIEISEKYQLDSLKIICQDKLISRLSMANVCSMVTIADIHNADLLMSACIPLVRSHIRQLMASQEWTEMKTNNPRLLNLVLEKVIVISEKNLPTPQQKNLQPPQKRIRLNDMYYHPRMGKFDIQVIRFLTSQHFRILTSIEMGMKNHELVPLPLIASIAAIHRGATSRLLNDLTRSSSVPNDGFRLTTLGYDFLALRALRSREVVGSIGNQIGVGKEADVYVGANPMLEDLVLKFHRLGRTSFRKLKEKRDYHRKRHFCSWLYLSRLAAFKEFAFLKALYSHNFPVPKPIDISRHTVVMELIVGPTLSNVAHVDDPALLFEKLMNLIERLASYGLIHCDFNEFNIMLREDGSPVLIDFPQMVSVYHPNAEFYFNRDVNCVRTFFARKFHFDAKEWPEFKDVEKCYDLDVELEASGFTKQMRLDLNKAYDEGDFTEEPSTKSVQLEPSNTGRLQEWIDQARESLETIALNQNEITKQPNDFEKKVEEEDNNASEEESINSNNQQTNEEIPQKQHKNNPKNNLLKLSSVAGSTSTLSKDEIKRRLLMEKNKAKKEKLRVKGQQNAVRRGRQQNKELIKEYVGWDCY
uniref:non-specific serine/threonine protein kinase n=1 Tax=Meloidogyne javanica TaxID=6303 RepID=A0A915MVH9_MELJA